MSSINTAQGSFNYAHVTADTQVKGQAGFLHGITVNAVSTGGVLTLYDNTAESGTVIAAINLATRAAGAQVPHFILFDIDFDTALYAGFDGTLDADLTFSYK